MVIIQVSFSWTSILGSLVDDGIFFRLFQLALDELTDREGGQ